MRESKIYNVTLGDDGAVRFEHEADAYVYLPTRGEIYSDRDGSPIHAAPEGSFAFRSARLQDVRASGWLLGCKLLKAPPADEDHGDRRETLRPSRVTVDGIWQTTLTWERVFERKARPGAGYGFPSDEAGNIEWRAMYQAGKENAARALAGDPDLIDCGVREFRHRLRLCLCGSGRVAYWLSDGLGIPLRHVCEDCESKVRRQYRPEIFGTNAREFYEDIGERVDPLDSAASLERRSADRVDGFDRDDLGESPDF